MWDVDSDEESGVNVGGSSWMLAAGCITVLELIGYGVSKFEAFTTTTGCKRSLLQVWTSLKSAQFSALHTNSADRCEVDVSSTLFMV